MTQFNLDTMKLWPTFGWPLSSTSIAALSVYAVVGFDPKLALDFIGNTYRTGGADSTLANSVTHARAGQATMVDSDGLLKWAPHNLMRYSEDFNLFVQNDSRGDSSLTFTQITDNTNPVGASSVTKVSPSFVTDPQGSSRNIRIYQNIGATQGNDILSLSVFVKPITTTSTYPADIERDLHLMFAIDSNANSNISSYVNLNSQVTSGSNVTYTSVGDGWYKATAQLTRNANLDTSTNCYVYLTNRNNATSFDPYPQADLDIRFTGFHTFRSDMEMANNPDTNNSYVPTTSSAVYLPRVGHHVYNGSAWVNEGILHESEARTNIVKYSENFTIGGTDWLLTNGTTATASSVVSPDGTTSAYELGMSSGGFVRTLTGHAPSVGETYTASIWLKAGTLSTVGIGILFNGGGLGYVTKNLTLTNEWQRFHITGTVPSGTPDQVRMRVLTLTDTGSIHAFGAQAELGSTPSSYIPTSGSSVTRVADTLTVPAANLPYPTPVETTGTELIANGTFDSNTNGWASTNSTLSVDSNRLKVTNTASFGQAIAQTFTTVSGKTYLVTGDLIAGNVDGYINVNEGQYGSGIFNGTSDRTSTDTSFSITFKAVSHITKITLVNFFGSIGDFNLWDNVSVKEINPLALSIQMDGKMSWTDENISVNKTMFSWTSDASNFIRGYMDTGGALTGRVVLQSKESGVDDFSAKGSDDYTSGTNVAFNISSRHGSSFLNHATDGTALTANTTPTALPNLSSSTLSLGFDFMGTIGQFRMWDEDLTDAGIIEATEPSTEPSLQLTFDGSSTSSFTVLDWSE